MFRSEKKNTQAKCKPKKPYNEDVDEDEYGVKRAYNQVIVTALCKLPARDLANYMKPGFLRDPDVYLYDNIVDDPADLLRILFAQCRKYPLELSKPFIPKKKQNG